MTITFVNVGSQTDSGTANSDIMDYPNALAAGDLVILVVVACAAGNDGTDDSYTLPGGWTQLGTRRRREIGTYDLLVDIWYQFAVGGETSATMTAIGTNLAGDVTNTGLCNTMMAWRGVDTTTPFDGVAPTYNDAAAASTWTPPAIAPATAGAWVVSVAATNDNNALNHTSPGAANGFTLRASGSSFDTQTAADMALGVADKPGTQSVSETMCVWNQSTSGPDPWVGVSFVLREIGASAGIVGAYWGTRAA